MSKYLKKYGLLAVLAALAMVAEVLCDLYQPSLMATIVDDGILGLHHNGTASLNLVLTTGVKMIFIVMLGGLCGVLCGALTNVCGQNFGNDIRKDCFRRVMFFSFAQTDYFSTGSLITRMSSDITQIQNMMMQLTRGLVRCAMFLIGGSCALLLLHVRFSLILLIAIPLILIEISLIVWKTNPLFMVLQSRLDRMNAVIQENVSGSRVVKAFVQEKREIARFEETNAALVTTQLQVLILLSWLRPIMNIILNMAVVAIIYVGAIEVKAGSVAPGQVMAAITYISQILNGMMMLAMIFQTLSRGMASSKRVMAVLQTETDLQDGQRTIDHLSGEITFEHVSFAYPGIAANVLQDLHFTIKPGETIAIIGATGCGKSTLVHLMARFYDATKGRILLDGVDLREYRLSDLRAHIGIVLQRSELFSGSIKDNIALGLKDVSDEEIIAAARIAQADDFIRAQREGYETVVAEGGMSLSGGQKQRINIARVLLKKPEIMIFDDATSALDLKTEAAFRKALAAHYPAVTKIIIAGRIASVREADKIVVMDEGKIIAYDRHERLWATCPLYQDICRSQLKDAGDYDE